MKSERSQDDRMPQHPPTPPNVHVDMQYGLQLQQQRDRKFSYDDSHVYGSGYGSPRGSMAYSQHSSHDGIGLGIHYDGYNQGSQYYTDSHHNVIPSNHPMLTCPPLTPTSAGEEDGRPQRNRKTTKSGKAKGKSDKPKTAKLLAPLSVLTKDMSTPIKDMEAWVNRSVDTRRDETERRNGYVTRPMNSFMLYRSAYADRTKQWCTQNNHQIVSSVSGESWPMEPTAIRNLYSEYAKIERINHQNAHPDYKFSPSKTSTSKAPTSKAEMAARKRNAEDELSDFDDAEWHPSQEQKSRRRPSMRRANQSISYPSNQSVEFYEESFGPPSSELSNRSSWDMSGQGRPMHMPAHAEDDFYHQVYRTHNHPSISMDSVMEAGRLQQRADTPHSSMQFSPDHSLLGLPRGSTVDLMQPLPSHAGTPLCLDGQVDPTLFYNDGHHHGLGLPVQHVFDGEIESQAYHDWQPLEDPEFDKWGYVGSH